MPSHQAKPVRRVAVKFGNGAMWTGILGEPDYGGETCSLPPALLPQCHPMDPTHGPIREVALVRFDEAGSTVTMALPRSLDQTSASLY